MRQIPIEDDTPQKESICFSFNNGCIVLDFDADTITFEDINACESEFKIKDIDLLIKALLETKNYI